MRKANKKMQKKWSIFGLMITLLVVLALIVSCAPDDEPPEIIEEVKTVKVGFLAPLTGPVAGWGLPGFYGAQLWEENVNNAGGIQVGDEKYLVEIIPYDTEYIAAKAVTGAKKLVEEDQVAVVVMMGGGDVVAASPYLMDKNMLTTTLIPEDINENTPYLVALSEAYPMYYIAGIEWLKERYDVESLAVANQDDEIGRVAIAYIHAACESFGIDLVYAELFDPDIVDLRPVVTAMVAANPEVLSWGDSWPEFNPLMTEAAHDLGFEGYLHAAEFILGEVLLKVPEEWLEARLAIQNFPDFDDSSIPQYWQDFYAEYTKRWPGEWAAVSWEYAHGLQIWADAVEVAGSLDPVTVFNTLKASETWDHPYGYGQWWGEELLGLDNWYATPWAVTEVQEGKHVIVHMFSFVEWYETEEDADILSYWLDYWFE